MNKKRSECIFKNFCRLTPDGIKLWTMDDGRCAGIFAERPTEWIAMSNPSAGNQRFCNYVYVHVSTIMQYLCIVHRMHYAAIHVTCVLAGMRLYMSAGPMASLKLWL